MLRERNEILLALDKSLNPVDSVRREGEESLSKSCQLPGFLPELLQIIVQDGIDVRIKQGAAIQLKNIVKENWDHKSVNDVEERRKKNAEIRRRYPNHGFYANSSLTFLSPEDKEIIRSNLVEAVCRCQNRSLRNILCQVVVKISENDFPEKWACVLPQCMQTLSTKDPNHLHAGLSVINKLLRKYRFKDIDEHQPMHELVVVVFPTLHDLLQALVSCEDQSDTIAELVTLCCKIFMKAIKKSVPSFLMNESRIRAFLSLFIATLQRPVQASDTCDEDARSELPWWKAKRRASEIFSRIMIRYAASQSCPIESKDFSILTSKNGGLAMSYCLPAAMGVLEANFVDMVWHSPAVLSKMFDIVTTSTQFSLLFKILKNDLLKIIDKFVFPLLRWSDNDIELWNSNSVEFAEEYFMRKYEEEYNLDSFYDLRHSASELLELLCRTRTRYVMPLVTALVEQKCSRDKIGEPVDRIDIAREKSVILRVFSTISHLMVRDGGSEVEQVLWQHVLPECRSPFPFMRVDACDCLSHFLRFRWSSTNAEGHLAEVLVRLAADSDLAVRVEATVMLTRLISEGTPTMLSIVGNNAIQVSKIVLKTLESDLVQEDLFSTLSALVEKFKVLPLGVEICEGLAKSFFRLMLGKGPTSEANEDHSSMAVCNILDCFRVVVKCYSEEIPPRKGRQDNEQESNTSKEAKYVLSKIFPIFLPVARLIIAHSGIQEVYSSDLDNSLENDKELMKVCESSARLLFNGMNPPEVVAEASDYMEETVDILHTLVFDTGIVPKECWYYIPLIFRAGETVCTEISGLFLGLIDTMVHWDPTAFVASSEIPGLIIPNMICEIVTLKVKQFVEVCQKFLVGSDSDSDYESSYYSRNQMCGLGIAADDDFSYAENTAIDALWVLIIVLESCPNSVDGCLGSVIDLIFQALAYKPEQISDMDPRTPNTFLNAISASLCYNPILTLQLIGQARIGVFFSLFFENLESNVLKSEKMVSIFGLAKILSLPPGRLPVEVSRRGPDIVKGIVILVKSLEVLRAAIETEASKSDIDSPAIKEDDASAAEKGTSVSNWEIMLPGKEDTHEDEDVFLSESNEYGSMEENAAVRAAMEDYEDDKEPEIDSDDQNSDITSPLDSLDEKVVLFDILSQAPKESQEHIEIVLKQVENQDAAIAKGFRWLVEEGQKRKAVATR